MFLRAYTSLARRAMCAQPKCVIPSPAKVMKARASCLVTASATDTRIADAEKIITAFKEDVRTTVITKIEELASRVSYERPSASIWDPECLKKHYACGVPGHLLIKGWRVHETDSLVRHPFYEVVDEFARSGWKLEDITDRNKSLYTIWRISA
jgi:hypothetical protein